MIRLKRWERTLFVKNLKPLVSAVDYGLLNTWKKCSNIRKKEHEDYKKLHTDQDDIISLPDELRILFIYGKLTFSVAKI
ncbi:hypothetical protein V6Z11_D11G361500 [Gossypium hirsutum]